MRDREKQVFYYNCLEDYNVQVEVWQKQNPGFEEIEVLQEPSDEAEGPFKHRCKGTVTYAKNPRRRV